MPKKFQLNIQKPCSEKFSDFKTTPKGGFCNSCNKEVIDFTTMGQREIAEYFVKNPRKTCGRFNDDQLKVYTATNLVNKSKSWEFLKTNLIGFSLLSILPVSLAQAQEVSTTTIITPEDKTSKKVSSDSLIKEKGTISGIVSDKEGNPLPGVNVILSDTAIGVTTNFDGKYVFPNDLKVGDILVFSYIGYGTIRVVVNEQYFESGNISVTLKHSVCVTIGEVNVSEVYSSKKTIGQRIKSLFK